MKLTKAAASLALIACIVSGPAFAQSTKSAEKGQASQSAQSSTTAGDSAKSANRTSGSESSNASGGATAQSPLEQRADRESDRDWSWLGLLGLLGLAPLFRRRHQRNDIHSGPGGGRRVAVYDDK